MISPSAYPWAEGETLGQHLDERGIPRRDFLEYCGKMAVILGIGSAAAPRVAKALESVKRPSVVWLQLQECTGCVESVLRTENPSIGDLLLDVISLDYNHTLMAGAGKAVEKAKTDAMAANKGKYLLVVSGSIPTKENDIYTMIGGKTARMQLEEAAEGCAAIIALGACAHWGGVQGARPNPTGAVGVRDIIKNKPILVVAGCPPIGDTVTATVVHFLTFGALPEMDREGRPLFAYGERIHDQCQRRAHFDAGQFVETFDDKGAREGWCLYQVGCKGPATFSPCPIFKWNTRTSWPIEAGHPCIGCTEPYFWDTMTPFYGRLPDVAGFGIEKRVDTIGASLAIGAAAGVAAHATMTVLHQMKRRKATRQVPEATEDEGANNG
ncbi:MAG: hydrogenase small subunit [Gemmatimonadetes bacterium]|nr:hydrogenase small subunit [Gemmatimonadota bacterium]